VAVGRRQLTSALEDMQRKKKGRSVGPLEEVDYWRERATSVCALYDQFNTSAVAPVLELFARIDTSLELLRRDIGKLYEEATDITRSVEHSSSSFIENNSQRHYHLYSQGKGEGDLRKLLR